MREWRPGMSDGRPKTSSAQKLAVPFLAELVARQTLGLNARIQTAAASPQAIEASPASIQRPTLFTHPALRVVDVSPQTEGVPLVPSQLNAHGPSLSPKPFESATRIVDETHAPLGIAELHQERIEQRRSPPPILRAALVGDQGHRLRPPHLEEVAVGAIDEDDLLIQAPQLGLQAFALSGDGLEASFEGAQDVDGVGKPAAAIAEHHLGAVLLTDQTLEGISQPPILPLSP